jgi:hypothetical protein
LLCQFGTGAPGQRHIVIGEREACQ